LKYEAFLNGSVGLENTEADRELILAEQMEALFSKSKSKTMSFEMGDGGCEARVRQKETGYLSEVRGVVNWIWRACE